MTIYKETTIVKEKVVKDYLASYYEIQEEIQKKDIYYKKLVERCNGGFIQSVTDLKKGSIIVISKKKYMVEKFSIRISPSINKNETKVDLYAILDSGKSRLIFSTEDKFEAKIKVVSI